MWNKYVVTAIPLIPYEHGHQKISSPFLPYFFPFTASLISSPFYTPNLIVDGGSLYQLLRITMVTRTADFNKNKLANYLCGCDKMVPKWAQEGYYYHYVCITIMFLIIIYKVPIITTNGSLLLQQLERCALSYEDINKISISSIPRCYPINILAAHYNEQYRAVIDLTTNLTGYSIHVPLQAWGRPIEYFQ